MSREKFNLAEAEAVENVEGNMLCTVMQGATALPRSETPLRMILRVLGFAQNFLSSCELEALHFIGIRSFGEEFREDVVFRGIQEKFRKPLA